VLFAEGCEVWDDEGVADAGDVVFAGWVEGPAGERGLRPAGFLEVVLDASQVFGVPCDRLAGLGRSLQRVVRLSPQLVACVRSERLRLRCVQGLVQVYEESGLVCCVHDAVADCEGCELWDKGEERW
jgi:hypothetical protein